MKISIIIPVYNAEKHIKRAIESILRQSYDKLEIIIVDDGSTDNTSAECAAIREKDHRVIYFKVKNGGPYKARIYGTEQATGDYVTFCDADDYYANRHVFKKLAEYLDKYHCETLQCGYKKKFNHLSHTCTNVKNVELVNQESFIQDDYPLLLCSFWDDSRLTTNVWNKVYSSTLIKNLPKSEDAERVFWGDDLIQNLFLLERCESILYVPDIFYVYQATIGGTSSFNKNTMNDLNIIKKYQLAFIEKTSGEHHQYMRIMYTEAAYWLLAWIRKAIKELDETELKELLSDTLNLSEFVKASEYCKLHPDMNWDAHELLKERNVEKYISFIKNEPTSESITFKEIIKAKLKNLYYKL